MIVLLLSCLKTYAQNDSSTGGEIMSDTTHVSVPIKYIRLANEKLIERKYYIEANQYKDSIIVDYRNYLIEYQHMEYEYRNKLKEYDKINKDLNKRLARQKKTSLICGTVAGVSIGAIILAILIN